ncbi:MAG: helix-turn-helix domain-containing protein [Terriglobales bacterium]|jgi:excisionase family DNA binding protein
MSKSESKVTIAEFKQKSFWTVEELATYMGTSVRAIRELCRQRTRARSKHPIPVVKVHGKMIRFRQRAIQAWLEKIAEEQGD